MTHTNPYRRIAQKIVSGGRLVRHWPLTGGVSAQIFALEIAAPNDAIRKFVVRRPGVAEYKKLEDDVASTEFELLHALKSAKMAVPTPVFVDTSGELLPSPYYVMSFVEGTTEVPDDDLFDALESMAEYLSRLHALDPRKLQMTALPEREDPIVGALEYLPVTPATQPLRDVLKARGTYRSINPPALLHGDFWPGNVLWKDHRIAAVIDWEDAAIGDPLCDLAGSRIELLWKYRSEIMEAFTEQYFARSSIERSGLPFWDLFVASSGLAYMDRWGLEPEVERRMRKKGESFIAHATQRILAGPG